MFENDFRNNYMETKCWEEIDKKIYEIRSSFEFLVSNQNEHMDNFKRKVYGILDATMD